MTTILVTGGAGYIGSHTVLALHEAGYEPVILDNFCNSSPGVVKRLSALAGHEFEAIEGDCRNLETVTTCLQSTGASHIIHFAGLKAVGESVAEPVRYYDNNVGSMVTLLQASEACNIRSLVFSSTATVYDSEGRALLDEETPLGPNHPYGHSKLMSETILRDYCQTRSDFCGIALRYFNPVGAHPSGDIGESPRGIPNNLLPFVADVAAGQREKLTVYGNDYKTPDGTGLRDYIHVTDLAEGHVLALADAEKSTGFSAVNLGSGKGTSVLEMIQFFEDATGKDVPYEIGPRRPGDVTSLVADPKRAQERFGFKTKLGIDQACVDSWRWKVQNPNGFEPV